MAAVVWTVFAWIAIVGMGVWMGLYHLPAARDHSSPVVIALTALVSLLPIPLAAMAVLTALLSTPTAVAWIQCGLSVILALLCLHLDAGYFLALPDSHNRHLGMPVQRPHRHLHDLAQGGGEPAALRVMTLNARYGRADAGAIVRAVRCHRVDVLALQEVSGDLPDRLEAAGLGDVLPVRLLGDPCERDNGGVNALYAAPGLDARPWNPGLDIRAAHPVAFGLHAAGDAARRVRLVSVHTASPQRGAERWGEGLSELARFADAYVPGTPDAPRPVACPLVIMGDMNATSSHASFREILKAGPLQDCSYELHHGPRLSFPASWGCVPPLLELDHIIHTSGVATTRMRSVHIKGTDHRAQIAELRFV